MPNNPGRPRRFRPARQRVDCAFVTEYSPLETGCPTVEQAIARMYSSQSEEDFWALVGALNYAVQMETRVLVPIDAQPNVRDAPAPWVLNPVPPEKAGNLPFWTVLDDKGRRWQPAFFSASAAVSGDSTCGRPATILPLQDIMQRVMDSEEVTGLVLDPWTHSASFDHSLLGGLLLAQPDEDQPGLKSFEKGRAAACSGDWSAAAECYEKAAEAGSAEGLTQLGACYYWGRGVRRNRTLARQMWKKAADSADAVLAHLYLGDDCVAMKDGEGKALFHYRRAQRAASRMPDIEYMPEVCLRISETETSRLPSKRHLAKIQAAEAAQGFRIRKREGDPDAAPLLEEAEALLRRLNAETDKESSAYKNSLQMD